MMMTQIFFLCQKNKTDTQQSQQLWLLTVRLCVCVCVILCCLWLYKIKTAKREGEQGIWGDKGGGGEHRAVWYVCHDQRPMTSMTIKAAKSAPGPPLPTTPRSRSPYSSIYLAHSRFSTLSCNLFFSFLFFLCIILFSFTIPFSCCLPKVYWSLTGLALTLLSWREGGAGARGARSRQVVFTIDRTQQQQQRRQLSHFFCSFFVKFTSAIPEIMSNIPRAMPKNKKKPNTNKKSTNKKQKEKTISRNR